MMAFCSASGGSSNNHVLTHRHQAKTTITVPPAADQDPGTVPFTNKANGTATATKNPMTKHDATCYPQASDLPPVGHSLLPIIWKRDPAPAVYKALYCATTLLGLFCLVFLADLVLALPLWELDFGWDRRHGQDPSHHNLLELMQVTLDLPEHTILVLLGVTLGTCLLFIGADVLLGQWHQPPKGYCHPWPKSWNTDNTQCYHDMFAEPTRYGRLIRRPGNTMSNAIYLFGALVVAFSAVTTRSSTLFWLADVQFAVMMFLLAIFSTIWHGSNAPWSQYPDVWTMDSCIVFLLLRYLCLGGFGLYKNYHEMDGGGGGGSVHDYSTARLVAGATCWLLYVAVIVGVIGNGYYQLFCQKWLHGPCPYSARARILGVSNIFGAGHHDVYIGGTVCAFWSMPIGFLVVPTMVEVVVLRQMGSIRAGRLAMGSLVLGWTYRMCERWVLDGNPIMNFFVGSQPQPPPSKQQQGLPLWRMVGAALSSGTAQMHFWTGVTLLAGYMHARSVEDGI